MSKNYYVDEIFERGIKISKKCRADAKKNGAKIGGIIKGEIDCPECGKKRSYRIMSNNHLHSDCPSGCLGVHQ